MRPLHFVLKQQDILQEEVNFMCFPSLGFPLWFNKVHLHSKFLTIDFPRFRLVRVIQFIPGKVESERQKFGSTSYSPRHAFPFSQPRERQAQPWNIKYNAQTSAMPAQGFGSEVETYSQPDGFVGCGLAPPLPPEPQKCKAGRVKLVLPSDQALLMGCK